MKKILMIALIAVAVISCNKNQKAVRILDGEWKATSYIDSDEPTVNYAAFLDFRMIFDGCKLKDNEFCSLTYKITFGTDVDTETFLYKVTSDGTVLETKANSTSTSSSIMTIKELSKKEATFVMVDGATTTTIIMEKQ